MQSKTDDLIEGLERKFDFPATTTDDRSIFISEWELREAITTLRELEETISKMNGGRSCKVCGQDYAIAAIAERMGFRPDVGALEIRKLQARIEELEKEIKRLHGIPSR